MFSRKSLAAKWTLGWALVKRVLLSLLPGLGDHGPRPWLGRLAKENLTETAAGNWERFAATSRCLGCGLCDLVGEPGESPSAWIMGAAREPSTSATSAASSSVHSKPPYSLGISKRGISSWQSPAHTSTARFSSPRANSFTRSSGATRASRRPTLSCKRACSGDSPNSISRLPP